MKKPTRKGRILVVDDDVAYARSLVELLSGAGHDVSATQLGLQRPREWIMAVLRRHGLAPDDVRNRDDRIGRDAGC